MHRTATIQLEHGPIVVCQSPPELAIRVGDLCVIKVDRTLEFGKIMRIEEKEDAPAATEKLPVVLRRATLQDQSKAGENAVASRMAQELCVKKMAELNLEIHPISVRYSFDRALLTVAFTAEERVDFRELVKSLATQLNTHVEMRQVGVRDAAKQIGGMGPCGQPMCCCRYLRTFETVSVKMAKVQRLLLSPNTISGMCGRLKCCLRHEYDGYRECSEQFPMDGAVVKSPQGRGSVVDKNILTSRVKVRLDDNRILEFALGEVSLAGEVPGQDPERRRG